MTRCICGHAAQLHTPTGRMDDTPIRGQGACTAGAYGFHCLCTKYEEKKR